MLNIDSLYQQLADNKQAAPVDKWNPDYCGEMDLVIKCDGSWHYMGTPITRAKLVNLFASVLKREQSDSQDNYYLVTPVEKIKITVEDVPFVITQWQQLEKDGQSVIEFTTQTNDVFPLNAEHPMTIRQHPDTKQPLCYVTVRRNLEAVLHRNVFYQLVEIAKHGIDQDNDVLLLESNGKEFILGHF